MPTKKTASKRKTGTLKDAAKSNPMWKDLTHDQKVTAWKRMFKTYARVTKFAAGKYNIVASGAHKRLRDRPQIETMGEDDALKPILRNQFINLGRNGIRNNETLTAVMHQMKVNVVGTVGGKAYFDLGQGFEDAEKVLKREFKRACSSCEFYDGMKFKDFLEIVLETVCLGGDVVIAFDNHTFEDSGKLLAYEPDSVANIVDGVFQKQFGKKYEQRQGRIYTKSSRFAGVIVSSKERGCSEFEKLEHCHVFLKDPNASPMECDWLMVGHRWRFNQGRGTSPLTAPLGSFLDVDILQGFEIEAGKLNAQMCAQVYQTGNDQPDEKPVKSPDLAKTEFDEADQAAIEQAAEEAASENPLDEDDVPQFQELESAGVVWNLMPAQSKMEILDTKHPNPNMNEFIRIVAGRGGWAMGVASVFTNGKVDSSYTGYRGEQIMTWPSFERWQKFLENICDWYFCRWFEYSRKYNDAIKALNLPDDVCERISWTWPKMREVNAVDAQNAWNMGLKNGTTTYADILGPDWKEHLKQTAAERKFCKQLEFPHPADETVSGQRIEEAGTSGETTGKENEE